MARPTKGKNEKAVVKLVVMMLRPFEMNVITTDNGTEFAKHKYIAKMLHAKTYLSIHILPWKKASSKTPTNASANTSQKALISTLSLIITFYPCKSS